MNKGKPIEFYRDAYEILKTEYVPPGELENRVMKRIGKEGGTKGKYENLLKFLDNNFVVVFLAFLLTLFFIW